MAQLLQGLVVVGAVGGVDHEERGDLGECTREDLEGVSSLLQLRQQLGTQVTKLEQIGEESKTLIGCERRLKRGAKEAQRQVQIVSVRELCRVELRTRAQYQPTLLARVVGCTEGGWRAHAWSASALATAAARSTRAMSRCLC